MLPFGAGPRVLRGVGHVQRLEPVLIDFLARAGKSPYVRNPRHLGLIAAVDLAHPDGTSFPYHWRIGGALCTRMRQLGIMSRPLADTLIAMPPLVISEENLRTLCDAMIKSLEWIPEFVAQRQTL